jgi:branched-chain amino acid transport system permease protein
MIDIIGTLSSMLTFCGIYTILSLSLNLEYGYAGLPNFGKSMFYAIGAIAGGSISAHLILYFGGVVCDPWTWQATQARWQLSLSRPDLSLTLFFSSLIISAGFGAIIGYLAAYPALKLKEDYLAITLLVFAEVLRVFVRTFKPIAGGPYGLSGIPHPFAWLNDVMIASVLYALLVWIIVAFMYLFIRRIVNSPWGRLLKAIRDDEFLALSLGKKTSLIKGQTLALGSSFAAVAGCLFAHYISYVHADNFTTVQTFDILVITILGGVATLKGPVIGAVIMTLIDRLSKVIVTVGVNFIPIDLSYFRYVITGLILILLIYYKPTGILKEEPIKTLAYKMVKNERDS